MKILLVGSGGREHALAEALQRSASSRRLFLAPGSDAMAEMGERLDIGASDVEGLLRFARDVGIDLTVVGPEAPLVAGIADRFEAEGLKVFGPSKAAATLEGSKVFTKNLLKKYRIPAAESRTFDDHRLARQSLQSGRYPVVLKADGLAAGKGVIIAQDQKEAFDAIDRIMVRREFGDAGRHLLVEEFLEGEEVSVLAITDGQTIIPLPPAKDHKAVWDGDTGPNTGGMGAFCPSPRIDPELYSKIEREVLVPAVHAMGREGRPYKGVLYAGLMITDAGPKVLEFNVRFGDPEAQVILPRLETDFADLALRTAEGRLESLDEVTWSRDAALVVILASGGYPGTPDTGRVITGLGEAAKVEGVRLYHSGTKKQGKDWVNTGGRVLGVTATGSDVEQARQRAYEAVEHIHFEGMHYRRDIGVLRG